jgi:3-oxoacyl-[acyl-carrier protein] reductase
MGVILVTGASRGIGRGIASALSAAGHRVAVHYNGNETAANESVAECVARFTDMACGSDAPSVRETALPAAAAFQANIAKPADRARLLAEVLSSFGRIDGLVNNAGIAPRRRDDIVSASEEIFDEVMEVNLKGPYFLTQLVARHWLEQAERKLTSRVVFVTSVSATMASTSRGEYCVSKAALAMGVQLFAARLAGEGILVFEIRPGITKTDMTTGVTEKYDRLIDEGLVPQRRWGFPEDTGNAVQAIMNGQLDFSPGSVLYTDGGLHLSQL